MNGIRDEKKLRVLAIEDSEDDFELVRNELEENGFAIEHERVDNAKSLKAALGRGSWDVAICDHNMPALDSLSALRIVQEASQDMPFIIVSGSIQDEVAVEAMRRGARDFIRKGNLSRLAPAIEREIRQAAMQSELEKTQENLFRISHFDGLTGLPNSEYLIKYLRAMTSSEEYGHSFAVFLIDLNRFRQITKTLGVPAGNKVLLEAAARLRAALGEGDFVSRYGADRFVVVVPHIEQETQGREVARTIHQCMQDVFIAEGHELFVKASVGASFYPRDGRDWDDLFKNAESALYGAKADGGSSYRAYQPEMDTLGRERLTMETALYRALDGKQFVLHYQPQYDLQSGRMVGAEALVRWRHPGSGMVPPGKFISILEETGLIVPVGEWILRTACAQNRQWQEAGLPPIRVAVNLSMIQFRQPGLARTIEAALKETGLSPEHLEIEITENIAMHAEEKVIAVLGELRATGVQIAIDDFGTGYSSLSYLKRFPIDKLKIDQSFVKSCLEGDNGDSIVKAIIGMGRGLKLKVIAEGVETPMQAELLKFLGCDEAQGYYYGKPMEAGEMASLIERSALALDADKPQNPGSGHRDNREH